MQRALDLASAVATHLDAVGTASRQAGSPFGRSTYCFTYALYLSSMFVHDMPSGNPDMTDRSSRGLQRPWDSAGRHVYILNKPEQLRGPLSPHRKDGTQNWEAGISGPSVVACVPPSTQGRLCVLDCQDSCSLPHGSARPSRMASRRFRHEPS